MSKTIEKITGSEYVKKLLEQNGQTFNDVFTDEELAYLHLKPILSGSELFLLPEMINKPLIDGILWEGDVAILLAKEKVGKSILAMQMACALTSGIPLLNQYDVGEACNVLYIQAEGSRRDFIGRLKRMAHKNGVPWNGDKFYHMFPAALALDTNDQYDTLVNDIRSRGFIPKVIFVDPLYMAMEGDLIDNRASKHFCRNIRRLQAEFDASIIVVHHENRGAKDNHGHKFNMGDDAIFGSFVWKAFPSHVLLLKKTKIGTRVLSCTTQRSSNIIDRVELKLHGRDESVPLMYEVSEVRVANSNETVFNYIKSQGKDGCSAKNIIQATGLSESNVRRSLGEMFKEEKIFKLNPGHQPVFYGLEKKDDKD